MGSSELLGLAMVSLTVAVAMAYTRFASSRLRPGLARLAAVLPVLVLLVVLPLSFSTIHLRLTSAFFLAWLAVFKLVLLTLGRGPLDPSLPLLPFICTIALPVKLIPSEPNSKKMTTSHFFPILVISSAVKAALLAVLVSLYRYKNQMNPYLLLTLYCLHLYFTIDLILACTAAVVHSLLGMMLEPQFNKPYFAESLRNFWGRRWNLMVSAILRTSVYHPVRLRLGNAAGFIATFFVSGLMHEVLLYYITLQLPTGEMTLFFLLHGVCTAAEEWWARRKGWWRPPRMVATPLTLVFVMLTGFWLFYPPLLRTGTDKEVIGETKAMVAFFEEAGRKLVASAGVGLEQTS